MFCVKTKLNHQIFEEKNIKFSLTYLTLQTFGPILIFTPRALRS